MKHVAKTSVVLQSIFLLALAMLPACASPPAYGDYSSPGSADYGACLEEDAPSEECGTEGESAPEPEDDNWCGLTFEEALVSYPDERVCQTTIYDRVTGYCTSWGPCSAI